ncbi:putative membrane protein [Holotrichia oblita]|uniref:Membrane protein n=1 Tax=Holotrichia oblita TaxID=644536 RepID=A0ACB9TA19_HOLOL|nr:putative membrane protein [Holotrichia oblita]
MDAILMFDVLLYLNGYYYLLAAICHPVMVIAKYFSPNYETPEYITRDVIVVVTMVATDLLKILIYKKLREHRKAALVNGWRGCQSILSLTLISHTLDGATELYRACEAVGDAFRAQSHGTSLPLPIEKPLPEAHGKSTRIEADVFRLKAHIRQFPTKSARA